MTTLDSKVNAATLQSLVEEELLPLEAGTVVVDQPSFRLRRSAERFPLGFGFSIGGAVFEAQAREAAGQIVLEAEAKIGRLPYSAEDPKRRADLVRLLRALAGTGLHWALSQDHTIRVGVRAEVGRPATQARIVAALVEAVIPVRGYLDLLAELAGTEPAQAALPAVQAAD